MKLSIYAISKDHWNTQVFSILAQQAEDSARKIQKGIDIGIERKRFITACNRIETLALQKGSEISINEKYLQKMLTSLSEKSSIFFPFVEQDNLKPFMEFFNDSARKHLTENQSTLVFVLNEFSHGTIKIKQNHDEALKNNSKKSNITELNEPDISSSDDIKNTFHKQILTAIKTGTPIGWINIQGDKYIPTKLLRHEGIVTCLREHIYARNQPTFVENYNIKKKVVDKTANHERSKSFWFKVQNFFSKQPDIMMEIEVPETKIVKLDIIPQYVQFAFSDGSISDLFPLYSMIEVRPEIKLQVIKAALISCRHFELDLEVETSIIRNSEISRKKEVTIADQERLSFEIAKEFFNQILEKSDGAQIELYHTGLEPAVIGTYRAFISTILKKENRGRLIVTPKIFKRNNEYLSLRQWY